MTKIKKGNLSIDKVLVDFITEEAIPGTDTNIEDFWSKFDLAIHELGPINKKLIQKREAIQKQIDDWHLANKGKDLNRDEYFKFLKSIGYIVDEKEDFLVSTANVDDEIAKIAGPQLVVPIDNARYALNAANARWGSLYDALYGTDIISEDNGKEKTGGYNPKRGEEVIALGREFLDVNFKLENGSWSDVKSFTKASDNLNI